MIRTSFYIWKLWDKVAPLMIWVHESPRNCTEELHIVLKMHTLFFRFFFGKLNNQKRLQSIGAHLLHTMNHKNDYLQYYILGERAM